MACGNGRTVCAGGSGGYSGESGAGIGIPLQKMPVNKKALVIVVSQSGETADTLAALRLAKEKELLLWQSSMWLEAVLHVRQIKVFYTLAGPEISVATTKAYSAQLAAMYCLAVQFASVRGKITEEQYAYYISELFTIPERSRRYWRIKNDFSGLQLNMPMRMMCSLSEGELIMRFLWRAV